MILMEESSSVVLENGPYDVLVEKSRGTKVKTSNKTL